jgi:lipid-A-disaccharide synthase
MTKTLQIAMVAGEPSGDLLAAGLIQSLQVHYPDAHFVGIGGKHMQKLGFHSLYPMEWLSVMGLVEVLGAYPKLKRCHRQLIRHFCENPPHVFIGIDAPDFNLPLEKALKQQGIPTVHYVSPSVWAWRAGRVKSVAQACDLLLTVLPFETAYYAGQALKVQFVGHPLADNIALVADQQQAKEQLGLPPNRPCIALLAGSRQNEVQRLAPVFLQTAQWLQKQLPDVQFVVPLANQLTGQLFKTHAQGYDLPLHYLQGQAQTAMMASDAVLLASGTATLEAMLCQRPMVVAYRLAPLTYYLAQFLVKTPYIALPNLLLKQAVVPEFIQQHATVENLGNALLRYLQQPQLSQNLQRQFHALHLQLRQNASQQAAQAVLALLADKKPKRG